MKQVLLGITCIGPEVRFRKVAQLFQLTEGLQVYFVCDHHACGREQIRGAKTHFAATRRSCGGLRDSFRRRKGKDGFSFGRRDGFAEATAQYGNDLANLNDLFGRRKDERSEAFPRLLAQKAKSGTSGQGSLHWRIVGKCVEHLSEVYYELQ